MVSSAGFGPFEDSDFNELAKIIQTTWYAKAETPSLGLLEACYDLARCLSNSTFSQVARIDGAPCGVVLARGSKPHPRFTARWTAATENFAYQLRASEPEAAEAFLSNMEDVDRANEMLHASTTLPQVNEITLLIVEPEMQNLGIGSVLLNAASSYLTAHDATEAYLYTDTGCNWRFYEERGFKRIGTHHSSLSERRTMPRELYLYRASLSS